MTTYNSTNPHFLVKVIYEDPAGGFAGWFLHAVNGDHQPSQPSNGTDAGTALTNVSSGSANASTRSEFLASVTARLQSMFGPGVSVSWSANVVQSVTPAVIDDDF